MSSVGGLLCHLALVVYGCYFLTGRTRLLKRLPTFLLAEIVLYCGILVYMGNAVWSGRMSSDTGHQVAFLLTGFSVQFIALFPLWGCSIRRKILRAMQVQPRAEGVTR